MEQFGWCFGNQSRAGVRIGESPDFGAIARAAADAGVGEAMVFGKCHTGFCFFPTKKGIRHPRLKTDMLGGLSRALSERGIRVSVYVNFGLDGEAGRGHSSWLQRDSRGMPAYLTPDHYARVCPFTPYLDRYLLPLVREMLELYPLRGVFFDTMTAFDLCYCGKCVKEFESFAGSEMPREEDDPAWEKYGFFQKNRAYSLLERAGSFVRKVSPGADAVFNHIGGLVFPGDVPPSLGCRLSSDPQAREPWISMFANFLSSSGRPGDVFIERFYRGWGDRSGLPEITLEQKAAPVFAYRRRFFVGDRLHPEIRLAPGSKSSLQFVSTLWKKMDRYMPPDSIPLSPDVVVLHSEAMVFGKNLEFFGRSRRLLPSAGVYQLMVDCGWNFILTSEHNLEKWLLPGKFLVLPEVPSVSWETDKLIRGFLSRGGRLLAAGNLPLLPRGDIPEWLGIKSVEENPWQEYIYLPGWGKSCRDELPLVKGDVYRVESGAAEDLLYPFACYDFRYGTKMGAGVNPPERAPDSHPLLTRAKFGRGKAYYLNAPLFSDYTEGLYEQKLWFEHLLKRIFPGPRAVLDSESGGVELVSYGNREDRVSYFVLINHGGTRVSLSGGYPRTLGPLPPFRVNLVIRPYRGRILKSLKINGAAAGVENKKGRLRVPVVMDSVWKIARVEWG